jgi:hypothetical protein
MEKQMLNWRELNDQANPGRTPARPQSMVATLAESEDVLIADPRGQMTPAQMVDQKLLALPVLASMGHVFPDRLHRHHQEAAEVGSQESRCLRCRGVFHGR